MSNFRGHTTFMTIGAVTATPVYPMNQYPVPFNASFVVEALDGGDVTYSVQHTLDEISAGAVSAGGSGLTFLDHSDVSGVNASSQAFSDGNYAFPITGVRLNVTAVSGSARMKFTVLQQGF